MGDSGDAPCGTLERYANILQSGTKHDKQSALCDLKKIVGQADADLLLDVRAKLQNQLIISLQDRAESVREGALIVSKSLIERLPADGAYVAPLVPALYARVCHRDDRECSEELLALMAEFAILLVEKYGRDLAPYVVEIVEMICQLLAEPSPQIKTTSSLLVVSFSKNLPRETFCNTGKLWRPLVTNITHQRWRVRVSTVEAIEWLMLKGDNKFVAEVTPSLNKKMLDSMHQVRLALVKLAGHWLVKLPDRYSFFSHLIPIVLSGLADDNDDIARQASILWREAGDLYLKENDAELKDKINYEEENNENYPPNVPRPNLGCRVLMEREASKFLLALSNELTDWVEIVRIKASILLTQVVLHLEKSITMSLRKIVPQICRAARDENQLVVQNVKLAAEYIGRFVPADVYCQLVVEHIREADEGELLVVAALVRGTRRADLLENLDAIASLMEPQVKGRRQEALLDLIESAMRVGESDVLTIGETVFAALVSVVGLAEGETIRDKAARLLDDFAILGGDRREVFANNSAKLLAKLEDAVWATNCQEQFVLEAVVEVAAEIVTDHLDRILRIFKNATRPDVDPEVLLKIFMTINALLCKADVALTSDDALAKFVRSTLSDCLPAHLRWSAGRKAEALRTAACTCLFMCLSKIRNLEKISRKRIPSEAISPGKISPEKIEITDISQLPSSSYVVESSEEIPKIDIDANFDVNALLPLLMSLIQDPAPKTRILALKSLQIMSADDASDPNCSTIVAQVVKRLDDADNSVRRAAVGVIADYYARHLEVTPPESVNKTLAKFVFSTLLIHLDDKDEDLKISILNCLRILSEVDPRELRAKVCPDNFIDKDVCQKLIDFLDERMKAAKIS